MKPLKESLYDIISPTRAVAEGVLDVEDIISQTDDEIARSNTELIRTLTGGSRETEATINNGTLYIKCTGDKVAELSTFYESNRRALMSNHVIKHIVCDGWYAFRSWDISALKASGIESITARVMRINGRCEFDCSVLNEIKLVADSFVIIAHGDRGKNSKIQNLNLKCKKTIKMISVPKVWGDELFLENVTVDCNKVILASRQNFNTSFGGNPWESRTFSGMGFTPQSKFKQIDCLDDKGSPEHCTRYSKKKPKDWNDNPDSHERKFYCWEMEDKPGWYCDTKIKPTKALLKV